MCPAFPTWGDQTPVCEAGVSNGANFDACDDNQTRPVGSFQPNGWGLFDVHGNVWEWVYWCPYPGCTSEAYVLGGAWNANAAHVRTDSEATGALERRYADIGFRVAKILQD